MAKRWKEDFYPVDAADESSIKVLDVGSCNGKTDFTVLFVFFVQVRKKCFFNDLFIYSLFSSISSENLEIFKLSKKV